MKNTTNRKSYLLERRLLFYATAIALTIYSVWRMLFTLPLEYGIVNLLCGVLLLVAEISSFLQMIVDYRQLYHYTEPELPEIPLDWYPDVDVLIATHNESVDLLYKTANACTFLRYPAKEKVHVYICDDGNRPEVAELARLLGVGYFGMAHNDKAKAGNLNNALGKTDSPLVATLDADMIPRSNFLMETVPFFFLPRVKKKGQDSWEPRAEAEIDPAFKIGYVQTPQSFYNPDLFQYYLYSENSIPNEQDYFFREVNVAHNYDNAPIYAGSNTLLSRQALRDVGFIATESITEDFMTGIRIQKAGYTNYATAKPLAHGLAPDRIKSLLNQRERWGRGNIQTMRREHVLLSPDLTLRQKLSNAASFMYWQGYISRMLFILAPAVQVLFNMRFVDAEIWQILLFWLPAYLLHNKALRVLSGNITNHHWSNVVDTIFAPYLCGPVLFEDFGISQRKFVVTEKDKRKQAPRRRGALFALPHIVMALACAAALFITVQRSIALRMIYNPIVLYWLLSNLKSLLFAIFFMFGRSNVRMAERFTARLPVTIFSEGTALRGVTTDISESGMAVLLTKPAYLPADKPLRVVIRSHPYQAEMLCEVVAVHRAREGWKYGLREIGLDAENKRLYMQIVYDRDHSLPNTLSPGSSVIMDINTNIARRAKERDANQRRLPRLLMNLPFQTADGQRGRLLDLNFEYAGLRLDFSLPADTRLTLDYGDDLRLELKSAADVHARSSALFSIVNAEALREHPDLDRILEDWEALRDIPEHNKPVGRAILYPAENPAPQRGVG